MDCGQLNLKGRIAPNVPAPALATRKFQALLSPGGRGPPVDKRHGVFRVALRQSPSQGSPRGRAADGHLYLAASEFGE